MNGLLKLACVVAVVFAGTADAKRRIAEVVFDPSTVRGLQTVHPNPCGFRLKEVVDARPASDHAGSLGWKYIEIRDAAAIVRGELHKAGLRQPESEGRDVVVRLRRLYVSDEHTMSVPVVVYSVEAQGLDPVLVRAHPVRVNWTGSDEFVLDLLSFGVHSANDELMQGLEAACKP